MNIDLTDLKSLFIDAFEQAPDIMAWAPGRIEFLGNHTDYNLGGVLGSTINRGIVVMLAPRSDDAIGFTSFSRESQLIELTLDSREKLTGVPGGDWVNYPLGVLNILIQKGMLPRHGFNLGVWSDLPEGAGLSSSAALEIATALALGKLYAFPFPSPYDLMRVGWRAEREFVGMPCGILDQTVVVFGDENQLVSIDCKREVASTLPFPAAYQFWIFNSVGKHALVDSLYSRRNAECMDALSRLKSVYGKIQGLCDVSMHDLEAQAGLLDETLLKRARHICGEQERVARATKLLREDAPDMHQIGQLLFQSHDSSRIHFENSTEDLDFLVDSLQRQPGVMGARLTGGGFGGAVLALTDFSFDATTARAVAEAYAEKSGVLIEPLAVKSGPGARLL